MIYNCEKLVGDDPLVIWHNQVIEKSVDELTISDVARCFRQKIFLDEAYEMLLIYLLHNPYEGDIYKGELMDKACEIEEKYIIKYKNTIKKIIKAAYEFIQIYAWENEEDKAEYTEAVDNFAKKIEWKKKHTI